MLPFANLATFVLAAMVAFVPLSAHSTFEPAAVTESRYRDIARDIATVSEEAPAPGLDAPRTAVLLASVASFESQFSSAVDACERRGGTKAQPSYSLWQVAGARADLCTSRLAAARIALGILSESLTRCRWRGQDALSFFTRGKCGADEKARWRYNRAHDYWVAHVFEIGGA